MSWILLFAVLRLEARSLPVLGFRPVDLDAQVTVLMPEKYCRSEQFPPAADVGRFDQDLRHVGRTGSLKVDFSAPRKQQPSMNGIFFATSDLQRGAPDGQISDGSVQALKPALWTTGVQTLDVAKFFGATVASFLGQKYAAPPWQNYGAWESFVRSQVGANPLTPGVRPAHFGKGIHWLAWNEPDCQYEWSFQKFKQDKKDPQAKQNTFRHLFEMYQHAYATIRSLKEGDKEIVAGIAWNQYDRDVIGTFLEYCLDAAHPCEINAMDWHELGESNNNLPLIQEHIEDFKRTFLNRADRRYEKLKIRKILINESVVKQHDGYQGNKSCKPKSDAYDERVCYYPPGEVLATKYFAERGGADLLSVTNFLTATPEGSFGGRFDPDSQIPRPFWWAEKLYADLGSTRVPCDSDHQQIVCFAAPGATPQILVAYYGPAKELTDGSERRDLKPVTLTLQLSGVWGPEVRNAALNVETILSVDDSPMRHLARSVVPLIRRGAHWTADLPALTLDQAVRLTPVPAEAAQPR